MRTEEQSPEVEVGVDGDGALSTTHSPTEGPWSPKYRMLTIGLLLTITGSAFEALAVATILPSVRDDLGGLAYYGWVFSAFMLANLVGITVAGGEADLYGPGRPLLFGVALFTAGLIIGGLAPSMLVLILARAIQGFGAGVINSVAYVVIGRGYPEATKARMLAYVSTAWVVPGLIGPAVSGLIADHIGWRWVFLGLAPLPVAAAAMTLPIIRKIPAGAAVKRDTQRIMRAVQLAAGAGVLLAGLGRSQPLLAIPLVVIGVVVMWPGLQYVLPAGTLRAKAGLPAALAMMGLLNFSFFGVEAFIPLGLTALRDVTSSFAGITLTAATITWTAGSWLLAHVAPRQSRRVVAQIGLFLIVVGVFVSASVLNESVPVELAIVAWGIAGLGIGLAWSCGSLVVFETAPPGEEGAATSSMQVLNALGIAIGTGTGGAIVNGFSSGDDPTRLSLLLVDATMIVVLLFTIVVANRMPSRPSPKVIERSVYEDAVLVEA
jgi:MFS family permease